MRKIAVGLLGTAALLAGCRLAHVHMRPGHHPPDGRVVAIEAGHVHTAHCGHYYHSGSWLFVEHHVHGPGCGHVLHGGLGWVYAEPAVVHQAHVCTVGCSHYHHGGRWYTFHGHRHGPRCGHALRGGVWVIAH